MIVQRGLSKSVKKAIVKNHLQGLNERENAKSASDAVPGPKLSTEEVDSVIKEFDSDAAGRGLEAVSKDYGVSSIAKELSEIARFKQEKKLKLASILEGARIASTLKKSGTGVPEFEQFLNSVYSRSIEKGYTPNEIISQSSKLQALEKKYNMNFEALRTNFEELGKSLAVKKKEKTDLETEIAQATKKKAELLAKFSLDEEKLQDYTSSKQQLSAFGFDVAHLQNLKNFLLAARNENFDVREISTKLNSIGDLQLHKAKIQQEVKGIKEELDSKKKELDAIEFAAKDRIKKLEERFAKQKEEIDAYSELRALGIDGKRILSWNQIMKAANVDYGTIEGELRNQGNLKNLEDK
ncbi:MAG TPA: hypothetical protein VED17_07875, partial [Nitrososphaerales archaeon]|nr:hypothetical protein [Nitrososphaerales archaeon]